MEHFNKVDAVLIEIEIVNQQGIGSFEYIVSFSKVMPSLLISIFESHTLFPLRKRCLILCTHLSPNACVSERDEGFLKSHLVS